MKAFRTGFTFVELIVVIALISLVVMFTVAAFQNYARFQQYNEEVATVESVLHNARVRARSSEGGQPFGVRIQSNQMIVYPGATYSAMNPANEVTAFSEIILSPALSNGGVSFYYNILTGLPSATGTIAIDGVKHTGSTTIEITAAGGIQ